MKDNTRQKIIDTSKQLFAVNGYEGFSIRVLAKESGVGASSIYHFFNDKDHLLKEIFDATNISLGVKRQGLPMRASASSMLRDRIEFQFKHIEDVIFVLKYYLHYRTDFIKLDNGYFPAKGYLHISEVLEQGVASGEFSITASDIDQEAKVITHAINGFLIEYYPNPPSGSDLERVVESIHTFLIRSLTEARRGNEKIIH